MTDAAPGPAPRVSRARLTRSRWLRRASSQAGLVAALLAVFTVSATAAGTCALLLTAGNERALSAAVAQADGTANDDSPDITTVNVTRALSDSSGAKPPDAATLVPLVQTAVSRAAEPYPAAVSIWTTSTMLFLEGEQVRTGYLLDADTLPANATLRSGAWPTSPPTSHGTVPVAIPATTATALRAHVGSRLRLAVEHVDGGVGPSFDLVVTGIFDPSATRAWNRDTLNGRGYDPDYFRIAALGPFVVAPGTLEARAAPVESVSAVLDPDLSGGAGGVPTLLGHIEGLGEQIKDAAGASIRTVGVRSRLGNAYQTMQTELSVSTSLVLAVFLLVFALGVATASLVARALVGRRAAETTLLRDRGGSTAQLMRSAVGEAAVIAALSAVLALPLALLAYAVAAPPPAAAPPVDGLSATAWLALVPAVLAGALFPAAVAVLAALPERARRGRQVIAGPIARSGIDVMLALIAVVAYLQLRAHVVTPGTVDPLLVAAPAVCAVALTALVTRVVPLIARLAEAGARRGRGFVVPMAGWHLARGGAAHGVFLLVLATAIGTLGVSFLGTWALSQEDQAAAAVGSDIVVAGAGGPDTARTLTGATGGIVTPVADRPVVLGSRPGGVGLLAIDAAHADAIVRGRLPEPRGWSGAMAGLAPGDGGAPLTIPGGPFRLTLTGGVPASAVGVGTPTPVVGAAPTVVLVDESGYRTTLEGTELTLDGRPHAIRLPLPGQPELPKRTWRIVGINLHLVDHTTDDLIGWSTSSARMNVRIAIEGASSSGGGWTTASNSDSAAVQPGRLSVHGGTLEGWFTYSVLGLSWTSADVILLSFPASTGVPVAMTEGLAGSLGLAPGDRIALNWETTPLEAILVRTVPYVPSQVRGAALLADRTALDRALLSANVLDPVTDAWWVGSPRPGAAQALRQAGVAAVTSREEAASELRDGPLGAPLQSAWMLAIAAAAGLGVTGAATHAAAQAQRQASTIARVRAIGASRRQVLAGHLGQHAAVTVLAVALGAASGFALAWLLAPLLVLSADGQRAVPPAVLVWPTLSTSAIIVLLLLGGLLVGVPAALAVVGRSTVAALRAGDAP